MNQHLPLASLAAIRKRIHFEDQGQDLIWLDIRSIEPDQPNRGVVLTPGCFHGKRVELTSLQPGHLVRICINRAWTTIKYPITEIELRTRD